MNTKAPQSLADVLGVQDPKEPERPPEVEDDPSDLTAEQFCQRILNSRQYRESIMRRIMFDELPSAVETLLWHFAHGKPVEKVEHSGKDGDQLAVVKFVRVLVDPNEEEDEKTVPQKLIH